MSRKLKYIVLLLILTLSFTSCHSPKFAVTDDYSVTIYPNVTFKRGITYKLYSVITPASSCSNFIDYYWVVNKGPVTLENSCTVSVEEAREALGSQYNIPDDSYCSCAIFSVSATSNSNVQISFRTYSNACPYFTLYTTASR